MPNPGLRGRERGNQVPGANPPRVGAQAPSAPARQRTQQAPGGGCEGRLPPGWPEVPPAAVSSQCYPSPPCSRRSPRPWSPSPRPRRGIFPAASAPARGEPETGETGEAEYDPAPAGKAALVAGRAIAPLNAPTVVKRVIAAAN